MGCVIFTREMHEVTNFTNIHKTAKLNTTHMARQLLTAAITE
jgi:hypothetical protein